jgi:hypothetical protein
MVNRLGPRSILQGLSFPYDPESGRLAQLGEHLLYKQGVGGSSPSPPISVSICARQGSHGRIGDYPVRLL